MKASRIFWIAFFILLLAGGFYYRYRTNAADERGATVLMRSFEQPTDTRQLMRLIRHTKDMNEKDKAGQTALFYAIRHTGDVKMVRRLIESGADVTSADNSGQTALMLSVRNNPSLEILEELIVRGSPINAADSKGQTALLEAAQHGTPSMVKLLLRGGANPEVKNAEGKTAAELIQENERFSEQEKTDYRQAMLVLAIVRPVR